jgi:hypothetical protein
LPSFYFYQVGLQNCWRPIFLVLPKIRWMPSWLAKPLELLLVIMVWSLEYHSLDSCIPWFGYKKYRSLHT